jgi:hypothetical protein
LRSSSIGLGFSGRHQEADRHALSNAGLAHAGRSREPERCPADPHLAERIRHDSVNNIIAKKSDGGSVAIQFGGCDGKIANCLPTMPGWNYMVCLYRPRAEILNGSWQFSEAQQAP